MTQTIAIPGEMRGVVARAYTADYSGMALVTMPVPAPGPNEVLIRVAAASINPSDLSFARGAYGIRKPLPARCGFEASGRVVACGPGADPGLLGKRVAALAAGDLDGAWAEYMRAAGQFCMPVPDDLSDEQSAALFVNPFTAWALIEITQEAGATALVQTAAGSALGGMIARLGRERGITVIDVVRRAGQAAELNALGRMALSSADPAFDALLAGKCKTHKATIALDAVGGALTGRIARAVLPGGRVIVYGGLSGEPAQIGVDELIFRDKHLEGFWLSTWLPRQPSAKLAELARRIPEMARHELGTEVRARYPFERFHDALIDYAGHMSGGKVFFTNPESPASASQSSVSRPGG